MTDRGLPIVDGAPACPFVAFEHDRDGRATGPDHRHRCYAEMRPAPRALAHQEAYCLSSAFPICPTFQDWARREAAEARSAEPLEAEGEDIAGDDEPRRNPARTWSAPPPWQEGANGASTSGLAGSMADRLAVGGPIVPLGSAGLSDEPPAAHAELGPSAPLASTPAASRLAGERFADTGRQPSPMARPPAPPHARQPLVDPDAPSWERPRRIEAYPSLRARVGLPPIKAPPLLVGVAALVLAAVGVFFLPGLLGIGDPGPGASASPGPSTSASAAPSGSQEPTGTPAPSPQVYVVAPGDTLSGIAQRFGLSLEALRAANPQITNPDNIVIGDEIIIPLTAPTQIPDAGSPSPGASA